MAIINKLIQMLVPSLLLSLANPSNFFNNNNNLSYFGSKISNDSSLLYFQQNFENFLNNDEETSFILKTSKPSTTSAPPYTPMIVSTTTPSFASYLNNHGNFNNHGNGFSFLKYVLEKSKKSSSTFSTGSQTTTNIRCENPDQDYLESYLSEYQVFYRKYEENVIKNKIEPTSVDNITDDKHLIDQTQCNIQERKSTTLNQASICPWKYMMTSKPNRYPKYRTEVKCTCDKCTPLNKKDLTRNIYVCKPVLKSVPVLIKGECGNDGFYVWNPTTEEVNVACVCAVKTQLAPVIKL